MPLRKIDEWPRTKKRLDHRAYQGLCWERREQKFRCEEKTQGIHVMGEIITETKQKKKSKEGGKLQ